jgi:hypothetical protein
MKVITAVVNNPEFIEIQYHTLKKYMSCDYEFIVFNDAKSFPDFTNGNDMTITGRIQDVCQKLNIKCINIPNDHHRQVVSAAKRCADSLNYMLKYQLDNPDRYLIIDSDMFMIDIFHEAQFEDYSCAVVLQNRTFDNYIWNGLVYFDITKLTNKELLNWGQGKHDVGGEMQSWLSKQTLSLPTTEELRYSEKDFHHDGIYFIKHLWSLSWNMSELPETLRDNIPLINFLQSDPRNQNGKFFCEIYDKKYLHYRAGGNWIGEGLELHNKLSAELRSVLLS